MTPECQVFISFRNLDDDGHATRDSVLAREVFEFLSRHGLNVFLSTVSLEETGVAAFKTAIDEALDAAPVLIVIGTTAANLDARWVRYEWDSFFSDILSGVKPDGRVFVYTQGVEVAQLPRALRQTQCVPHGTDSLERLYRFITNAPKIPASEETKTALAATVHVPSQRSDVADRENSEAAIVADGQTAWCQASGLPSGTPPTGGLAANDRLYIERTADHDFVAAIAQRASIVRVAGPRQVGKTSLLARGAEKARAAGAKVIFTDLQQLSQCELDSPEAFYQALGSDMAEQVGLGERLSVLWNKQNGPNRNFEEFVRDHLLVHVSGHLLWTIDEIDRLFDCPFRTDVFGLLRSWHNARSGHPERPWNRLTLAMAYATEAHFFIADLKQSPFNVGLELRLTDFTIEQVGELNQRHGAPLKDVEEVDHFYRLVNGHPYLSNRGLHEMARLGLSIAEFRSQATSDEGFFGEHLRRILLYLVQDRASIEAMLGVLWRCPSHFPETGRFLRWAHGLNWFSRGRSSLTTRAFHRLRVAGLLAGDSPRTARPRCQLYAVYLQKHLREYL